ncbi:right-handed parallel beta-helix repeat-containing protein [Hymenobacter cavernae]|uniref:Right handed beta helix domain-containing protein n=1 Tax=Hymenobacter cavernae TaxID=2044852 RepID=A0ABQ1UFX5_9BACT|nr:T9SS type A sorting domain-containing protein [Hymenobacter cavernae]GGF15632.1 hypothetical protein GCM10011383_28650 [Hymenobacter cavernae]
MDANAAGAGPHTIAFNIASGSLSGSFASNRALIVLASNLPAITAANVTIDGATQTTNVGDTNTGTLGTTTSVGVDGLAIVPVARPEVELSLGNTTGLTTLLTLQASGCTVKNLAIHGGSSAGILINSGATGFSIRECIIGSTALSYSYPNDGTQCGTYAISIANGAGGGTIANSLIGFNGSSGLYIINGGTTPITVSGCQFNQNGYNVSGGDAITLGSSTAVTSGPVTISGNLITAPNSSGVQLEIGATGITTIENNTLLSCGLGGGTNISSLEGSAICYLQRNGTRVGSNPDIIRKNVIQNSEASGIVVGYGQKAVRITQNQIFSNGLLSLDLTDNSTAIPGSGATMYGNGDGVTANRNNNTSVTASSPNGGIDYPIFTTAQLDGNTLRVAGYVGTAANQATFAGATVELFEAINDGNNNGAVISGDGQSVPHGELQNYLGSLTVGATGSFSGSLTVSNLAAGNLLAGTAWLSAKGTSEASNLITVAPTNPPVATDLTNTVLQNTAGRTNLSVSLAATTTTLNGTITTFTIVALPAVAAGALYFDNGTNVIPVQVGLRIPYASRSNLSFDPAAGFSGQAILGYTATDNAGKVSDGNATLTIPVNAPPVANQVANTLNMSGGGIPNTNAQTALSPLSGTDSDGVLVSFTVTALPATAAGVLYYNNGTSTVAVVAGSTTITFARAGQLLFDPAAGYNGQASFQYTATDDQSGVSAAATYTIPVGTGVISGTNKAPVADSKTTASVPVNAGSTSISAMSGTDPDGTVAGFTVKTLPSTGTLYFNGALAAAGTQILANQANLLTYRPSTIGATSFTYTATDNQGLESSVATFSVPVVGPLPVTLVRFVVVATGSDAALTWTTATEVNNAYFVVERSVDGTTFYSLGKVAGKGNTTSGYTYQFTDLGVGQQPQRVIYYRLRQVDGDGTTQYTPTRTLEFAPAAAQVQLAPNPTSTVLALQLPIRGAHCTIYSTSGQRLQTTYIAGTTASLNVQTLASGVYLLRVQFDAGYSQVYRFSKQ